MQHHETHISGFDHLQLYYQSWTPEQTRRGNVLVVHGHGEHSGRYLNVVNQLVPADYAVHAYDLRGHGRSEGERGFLMAWEEYRLDMDAVVNHVRGDSAATPLVLFGHSLGGLIALDYILHYPDAVEGLITSAPLVGTPGISPVIITVARILSRIAPRTMLHTGTDAAGISRDPAVVQAYIDDHWCMIGGALVLVGKPSHAESWFKNMPRTSNFLFSCSREVMIASPCRKIRTGYLIQPGQKIRPTVNIPRVITNRTTTSTMKSCYPR